MAILSQINLRNSKHLERKFYRKMHTTNISDTYKIFTIYNVCCGLFDSWGDTLNVDICHIPGEEPLHLE